MRQLPPSCADCALLKRRDFLERAMVAVAGALAALAVAPAQAGALSVRFGRAIWSRDEEHAYPIPATDGTTIDKDNQVILVRFEQKMYAFNLSCPHQNTALHWLGDEGRFQCPKHKSRYQPEGVHLGRATRNMDPAVRRTAPRCRDVDKGVGSDRNAAGGRGRRHTVASLIGRQPVLR
jgi:nitrite reductase/ring-hydroxylating ferredoxin subunit